MKAAPAPINLKEVRIEIVNLTYVSAAGWTGASRAQARGVTGQIRQLQTLVMQSPHLRSSNHCTQASRSLNSSPKS
jgi:hypothetical protein